MPSETESANSVEESSLGVSGQPWWHGARYNMVSPVVFTTTGHKALGEVGEGGAAKVAPSNDGGSVREATDPNKEHSSSSQSGFLLQLFYFVF